MNDSHKSFLDLLIGVPEGSILGPFSITFYIYDPFFFIEEENVTSFANNMTPFSNGTNVLTVLNDRQNKASKVFDWFLNNFLEADPNKLNLLLTSKQDTAIKIKGCIY